MASDPHPEDDSFTSSDFKYLLRLQFNPALRRTWLNFFVSNFRVVVLMILVITAAGAYAYLKLPRESQPEVKIPIAVVTTVYPGASPADVEELVTKKLETGIAGIAGIDTITSKSSNSFSAITVEFDPKENLDDAIRRLRDKVSSVKNSITSDAQEPQVTEVSLSDQPIWTAVISGPYDGFTLRSYAEKIGDELEKIPAVREVNISGGSEKEFEVAYDADKLLYYGISADQANLAIGATNVAVPAGNFEGKRFVYAIRADARVFDAAAIGNIPVAHSEAGGVVALRDIAAVRETAIQKSTYSRLSIRGSKSQDAVTISLVKRTGSSILDTVDRAKAVTDALVKTFPSGLTYDVSLDMAKFVRQDFERLTHDFLLTLLLVFGILFLVVGLKEAVVAGMAIPLVFFVTFSALLYIGSTLNFLSLFSLILALGLLVDDAIVVVSATKQYLKTGKFTPEEAVLLVLNDFKVVLTTTSLTTVWAFLPLLFATGIIGEFIKSIPITVSITIISSLLIALMINHPLSAVLERIRLTSRNFFILLAVIILGAAWLFSLPGWLTRVLGAVAVMLAFALIRWYRRGGRQVVTTNAKLVEQEWESDEMIKRKLLQQGKHHEASFGQKFIHGIFHLDRLMPVYEKYLRTVLATKRRRMVTIAATLVVFVVAVALLPLGIVKTEFFPAADMDYIYIDLEAPVGLKLDETDAITRTVEQSMLQYPEILNFSTIVGRASPSSRLSGSSNSTSNLASITITLKDKSARKLRSYELADRIRNDLSGISGAKVLVTTPSSGPPAGSAFEARIKGDDLGTLDRIAHELEPYLTAINGVVDPDISLKDAAPEYTFTLDPVKLEQHSLNAAYVGSMLRMAISGTEVSTVIAGGKEIKIMARFDEKKIPALEDVQNLQILNLRKQPVFLKDVARIELKPSVDSITRVDQKRTVLLSSGVNAKTTSNEVLAEFQKKISTYAMPSGYEIVYGGENEQNTESVFSILRAMAIAVILIVSTLVIQFNSFKKALIVLVTIPLALIGVFVGMAVFRISLSFPGLIGVLALFGIVVKNAIILIDKINLNLRSGIPFAESIVDAGKSRMEAIFITSICTIFGILPITLSDETWRSLGSAVIFGLSLSSFLTLFLVPVLFMTMIGEKERF
ncbi:MAG: efflux RND transporter permease subunit [Patescibacteria group bacterium]|nr:efflux RND transporter permease subunit [Patescibacteria group bacterium]